MPIEQFIRSIERKSDGVKFSAVKLDLGIPRLFREVGGKNDPLFNDDSLDRSYEPAFAPKEGLPKASIEQNGQNPSTKRRRREPSHGGQKL